VAYGEQDSRDGVRRRLSSESMRKAADLLSVGVIVADPDGSAIFANRTWMHLTGQGDRDWRGTAWLDVLPESDRGSQRAALLESSKSGDTHRAEWAVTGPDLQARTLQVHAAPDLDGDSLRRVVITAIDVTEDRAHAERLGHQATHDPLTGLYNRAAFTEFVSHALERQRRDRQRLAAVLFIDVDGLKATNDRYGHDAGDRLLRAAAARISAKVRPSDVVARYGGDEFAVLCDDLREEGEAEVIADRIRQGGTADNSAPEALSLSVGMALADDPHLEPAQVVAKADQSMYAAKARPAGGADAPVRSRRSGPGVGSFHDPETVMAVVAHELLSPLTAIAGFSSLLHHDRHRMSANEVEEAFSALERQSASLTGILEDLLELGRSHSGVMPDGEPVVLNEAICDALEVAPPPEGRSVAVHSDSAALSVLANRRDLARVVVNLLKNAYRHGGSHVTIGCEDRMGETVLVIEDDGPGVPEHLVPTLFMPFTRGRSRDGGVTAGAGVGLALAREMVGAIGGRIEYDLAAPHGARFTITLPATTPADDRSEQTAEAMGLD